MDDELLGAIQDEAVAPALGRKRGLLRRVAAALVDGERKHRLAGQDAGIPAVRMSRALDGASAGDRGRQEGRRRQVAADLFQHQRGLDAAEPEPALVLGNADSRQAKLGELLPEVASVSVGAAGVAPVPELLGDRSLPREGSWPPSPAAFSGRR